MKAKLILSQVYDDQSLQKRMRITQNLQLLKSTNAAIGSSSEYNTNAVFYETLATVKHVLLRNTN